MLVGIIGAGGQVADAVASLVSQAGHRVTHYRPNMRERVPGIPRRPVVSRIRLEELSVKASDAVAAESIRARRTIGSIDALRHVDVIVFALPSYFAERMGELCFRQWGGRPLINLSSRFLGTSALLRSAASNGTAPPSLAISFSSPPVLAYRNEADALILHLLKRTVAVHAAPQSSRDAAEALLLELGLCAPGSIMWKSSELELAFENTQSILHCVQDLTNLQGGLYDRKRRLYGSECFNDNMVERTDLAAAERRSIASRLGIVDGRNQDELNVATFGTLHDHQLATGTTFRGAHPRLREVSTPRWYAAHGFEDVGWALVPLEELGRRVSIKSPVLTAIIDEWSSTFRVNYRQVGRKLPIDRSLSEFSVEVGDVGIKCCE